MSDLASLLIDIVTMQGTSGSEKGADDIAEAARGSINRTLSVMSAADFVRAVLAILECGEDRVSEYLRVEFEVSHVTDRCKQALLISSRIV